MRGAATFIVSLRAPVTFSGDRLLAASSNTMPPMVTLEAPSMKPEPRRLNSDSLPGRAPSMPVSVGTTCRRRPALVRSVCAPDSG